MSQGDQPHILIIDANAHMRRLVQTLLGTLTANRADEARTPMGAVRQVVARNPDLIILDFAGDTTEGVLFLYRLRRGEFGRADIPVIALIDNGHHAVLDLAREAGIDEVLPKPLSAMALLDTARQLLRGCPASAAAAAE